MDPKEISKQHSYKLEEFTINLAIISHYLSIEAVNNTNLQAFSVSLTDEEIVRISHEYFRDISELYEILTTFLEETQENPAFELKKPEISLKFKRKSASFAFKLAFPLKNSSTTFTIELFPIQMHREYRQIQEKLEDFKARLAKISTFLQESREIDERVRYLEQKYSEFREFSCSSHEKFANYQEFIGKSAENTPFLAFSAKINGNFFSFSERNSIITRNSQSRKANIVGFAEKPLKKSGLQFFYLKVEGLNKSFPCINACIGVMTGNLYGKIANLAEHNGNGCYLYGVNSQCIWINHEKTQISANYGKINDVFKVIVDFEKLEVAWFCENKEIGKGNLDAKQIKEFDVFPVVTLAFPKESLRLI